MQPSLWVLRRMGAGLFLLCLGLMGCNYTEEELPPDDVALQAQAPSNPMGKGGGTMLSPPTHGPGGFGATIGNGIAYNGGPIMTTNTKLYYIWYGNWSGNTAPTILTDLA
ncbi:MAG: hypothetical protein ACJ8AT_34930, partial [Hyalangium sp.]|uniref:hypothetical protein n=1 Tax=Hyalangium sp. TaxID=2028555 RepID=UPI00389B0AAB